MDIKMPDLKLNEQQQAMMQGRIAELDGLTVQQIMAKRDELMIKMQPSDLTYKTDCASLALMEHIIMGLTNQNPDESHDKAFHNITEAQAMEDVQRLRDSGLTHLADEMQQGIASAKSEDSEKQSKQDAILKESNKKLAKMDKEYNDRIAETESQLKSQSQAQIVRGKA